MYYTLRRNSDETVDVLEWSEYTSGVLEGQPKKTYKGTFSTVEKAQEEYPGATQFSSKWTEPRVSLNHLPDENDPVPGGMYPDDI